MSEKLPSNQPQPIVKIGHYTLGQTLGVGTFGKVKSTYILSLPIYYYSTQNYAFSCDTVHSWRTCFNETQSRREDSESSENQEP